MRESYIAKFLHLRCAGDVLESIQPINRPRFDDEISEAMALIGAIRGKTLKEPGKWKIVDICAGNVLTGVIAAHLLPVECVTLHRWRVKPDGDLLSKVRGLKVQTTGDWSNIFDGNTIVVSASPNYDIAVEIANRCAVNDVPFAMTPANSRITGSTGKDRRSAFSRYDYLLNSIIDEALAAKYKLDARIMSENCGIVTMGL